MNVDIKKLENLRNNLGYTQKQFATKGGIKPNTYSGWKCGSRKPSENDFIIFCLRLDINPQDYTDETLSLNYINKQKRILDNLSSGNLKDLTDDELIETFGSTEGFKRLKKLMENLPEEKKNKLNSIMEDVADYAIKKIIDEL